MTERFLRDLATNLDEMEAMVAAGTLAAVSIALVHRDGRIRHMLVHDEGYWLAPLTATDLAHSDMLAEANANVEDIERRYRRPVPETNVEGA